MTFADLMRIVRRNVVLVAVATMIGAALGAGWAATRPVTFQSTAILAVVPAATATDAAQDPMTGAIAQLMQTYSTAVGTADVLEPVREEVVPEMTLEQLRDRIDVNVPTASLFIQLTARDADQERAVALADATAASLSDTVRKLAPKAPGTQDPTVTTLSMQAGQDAVGARGTSVPLYVVLGGVLGFVAGVLLSKALEISRRRGNATPVRPEGSSTQTDEPAADGTTVKHLRRRNHSAQEAHTAV